ncbi:kelch-like protein 10 [Ruditapes philippinarum]|uniref:kelch-like protein 10 n=1 Tax=Ruditapes philippinarum TaxID=129788 RepID=UPI00295BFD52|nr:kelch-like protein 10 [Ruditapes philippinarum]
MKMEDTTYSKDELEFRRSLASMRETGTFCDATLCIPGEEKTFPVHRAVMSSCSDFFRSLFTNGLQETLQHEVKIHDVTSKAMEVVIEYAYTKQVTITSDNAEEIFAVADRFNVLGLLKECIDFFSAEISPENCIGFLRFARYYNNKDLKNICWAYITRHFNDVVEKSFEYVHLNTDELSEIIGDDRLNVKTEDEVFDAVMKWIEFSFRERKEHFKTLLDRVRFPYITEECFQDKIVHRRDLKRGPCWDRISLSYNLVKKFRSSKDPTEKSRTKDLARWIKPRIPSSIIFVLGGWAKDGVTDSVETYDRNTDQWFQTHECELPQPRAYHGTITLRDNVYVVGGFNGSHYLNSVICFNVSKKRWEERAPMYMSRCYVSAVEMNGVIYVCGGYDGRQRHNSAEKYNWENNQWSMIKSMYHQRSDAGATKHKGKMYVAGGFDGQSCLFSAEVYDPLVDQWTVLAPMSTRRSGVSLVSCDDKIYAIGGYDGSRRLDTVEHYEPQRRHWYSSVSMILGRSNFSSVVMDELIYVMGGYDGEKTSPEVECYNPVKKAWFAMNDMNIGRSAVSACAVRDIYNARDFSFHGNASLCSTLETKLKTPTKTAENVEFAGRFAKWRTSPHCSRLSDTFETMI